MPFLVGIFGILMCAAGAVEASVGLRPDSGVVGAVYVASGAIIFALAVVAGQIMFLSRFIRRRAGPL